MAQAGGIKVSSAGYTLTVVDQRFGASSRFDGARIDTAMESVAGGESAASGYELLFSRGTATPAPARPPSSSARPDPSSTSPA